MGPAPVPGKFVLGPEEAFLEIGAIEIGITLFGIPLGILAMGWLTAWAVRGFRSRVE